VYHALYGLNFSSCVLVVRVQTAKLQEVQRQIERFSSQPAELCKVLQHIVDVDAAWPYEKSDLMHWAKVLDILDGNLAKDDSSDELLTTALKFTRLLLENCNNRHVYNSYEVCSPRQLSVGLLGSAASCCLWSRTRASWRVAGFDGVNRGVLACRLL
jgi:hypothetical protein